MQAYVLNGESNAIDLIDTFISFVWTDRYCGYGEFELVLPAQYSHITSMEDGRYLRRRETDHVMIIETMQVITDVETGNQLIASGRSLESILDRRVVWDFVKLTGNLQDCIFRLLNSNVINPTITDRAIPFFRYEASTDPYIVSQTVDLELHGENLYDVIVEICQERGIGFKVTMDGKYFVFKLYNGADRSYQQESNPWVVFSPEFENLVHTDYIQSSSVLKTAALVLGTTYKINEETEEEEPIETYLNVVSPLYPFKGLNRREIYVTTQAKYDKIDKESLGTAEDRVNIRDYQEYEVYYFDRDGWEEWKEEHPNSTLLTREDFYEYVWMFTDPHQQDAYKEALVAAQKDIDNEYLELINNKNQMVESDMRQAALNNLGKYQTSQSFDGELQSLHQYIFGRDFYMGDIVQVVNEYGLQGTARVTEIVYTHDVNGDLMYPTFTTV